MPTLKHLMIGCGSAALSALKAMRAQGSKDEVTLVTMEPHSPYSPMSLPYLIEGKKKTIHLTRPDFFTEMDATLISEKRVVAIHTEVKMLSFSDGSSENYDRLLIATGSEPIRQPVLEAADVPVFHVMDDCRPIQALKKGSRVTILGAGFVGMELAAALTGAGHQVEVVAPRERILRPYFDPSLDAYIIDLFKENSIPVHLNWGEATEVSRLNGGFEASFEGGMKITPDLLIAATGVRPRTAFLEESRIDVKRGIRVDQTMRTNIPDVYAAGDVAETQNRLTGKYGLSLILPSAVEQGKVAGKNMVGGDAIYEGWISMNAFNFFGHMAVSLGEFMGRVDDKILVERNPEAREYKKLVFREGRLIGANFFNVRVDSGVIRHLILKRADLTGNEDLLLKKPFETGLWLMQEVERSESKSLER
ncbi:MAG: FAD-dependent oxidoreductase [Deltaproteobacteria bacterium]|nr:FAD-dependent oxidoreductase [Deltaproteobacteria bacterium]